MKYLFITLYLVSFVSFGAINNKVTDAIYTEHGYPYNLLVDRAESINIIYTKKNDMVSCHTSIVIDSDTFSTEHLLITDNKFNTRPLASCLKRDEAKRLLKRTFLD